MTYDMTFWLKRRREIVVMWKELLKIEGKEQQDQDKYNFWHLGTYIHNIFSMLSGRDYLET